MTDRPDISPRRPPREPSPAAGALAKRLLEADFDSLTTIIFVPRPLVEALRQAEGQTEGLRLLKAAMAQKVGAVVVLPESLA